MNSVQSWVADTLVPDPDEQELIKVTSRLDPPVYLDLKEIAAHLGMSISRTAAGLLTSAVNDARLYLDYANEQEEEVPA